MDVSMHKGHFAYVQWFLPPRHTPERDIDMYMVSQMDEDGEQRGAIIPTSGNLFFILRQSLDRVLGALNMSNITLSRS
jgi:hypothetical protein